MWTTEKKASNVHLVRIKYQTGTDWEQRVLLAADRHWDNPHSDLKMQKNHLDLAREFNAPVVDVGDLFCTMQGKYDRRHDKSNLRPEHQKDHYLDAVVDTAVEFFEPYADLFAVIGRGNHDEAIMRRHETDLIERLCKGLGRDVSGAWRGFVKFMFERESGGGRESKVLYYSHGSGGGGQVSRGVTKAPRRSVYLPDADIVTTGHIHESWLLEIPRFRITTGHQTKQDTQYHIQLPTYKQEYTDGKGWVDSVEMPPKPLGAWWLIFYRKDDQVRIKFERAE